MALACDSCGRHTNAAGAGGRCGVADQDENIPVRKSARAWALTGLALSIPALFMAVLSSGGGHGNYQFARAAYPIPMLLTFNGAINPLSLVAALVQFPVYGWIVGSAIARREYGRLIAVAALHVLAMIACFSGLLPNFS